MTAILAVIINLPIMSNNSNLILIFSFLLTFAVGFLTVEPITSKLRDEYNRLRMMHGLNIVYKEFPYYPARDAFNSNYSLV